MDTGRTNRKFPSYTLAELERMVGKVADPAVRATMQGEIDGRKAGTSVAFKVPQVEGGKVAIKVGRL